MTQAFYVRESDGLVYSFCPVPLISESKEFLRKDANEGESLLTVVHSLTFNGILLPDNPALSGISDDATCLEKLDRKSDQLCQALDEDRGNLLIFDSNGYTVLNVRPIVQSLDFQESQMVSDRKYSITFEFEEDISGNSIRDFDDTWSFQANEDDTVSVNHSVTAQGMPSFPGGTDSFENARDFVLGRSDSLDKTASSFLKPPYVNGLTSVDSLTEFNHIRSENIDRPNASYSIAETWVLTSGNYKDDRTLADTYVSDINGNVTQTRSINGTIQGYGDTTFQKYTRAVNAFENIIGPEIGFFNLGANQQATRTDNRFAGTVNYTIQVTPSGADEIQNRQINRTIARNEDGTVTQTVQTSAQVSPGVTGIGPAKNYAVANNFPIDNDDPPFDASFSGNIESISVTIDELGGSYSLTKAYREQNAPLYREEYQIQRQQNVESAITTVTVNGTVVGLSSETATNSEDRFAAASGAYFGAGGIEGLIRSRALLIAPSGTCLGSSPRTSTLTYNKKNGVISYSQSFDNRFLSSNPNIVNEEVEISFNVQSDVIAEIPIPGKSTGPVLQDMETKTGLQKTLRITYRMADASGTIDCGPISTSNQGLLLQEAIAESDVLVDNTATENSRGEKPDASYVFKTADDINFGRNSLVFTRNVTWKYTAT